MKTEFLDYIEDILDAMDKAEILLKDVPFEEFERDFRINFAVVRALEILGKRQNVFQIKYARSMNRYPGKAWQECGIESSMDTMSLTCKLFGRL